VPALIVSVDGPDFSGKTTIANLTVEKLRGKHATDNVILMRTELPSILVTGMFAKILRSSADVVSPRVFALAYAADHLNHYEKIVKPLKDSRERYVVVQERSLLTTILYQGIIGGVDVSWIRGINRYNLNIPDLTLILVVDEKELLKRMRLERRGFDLFEQEEFIRREVEVFYNLPKDLVEEYNVKYIDSNRSPMQVAEDCAEEISELIARKL